MVLRQVQFVLNGLLSLDQLREAGNFPLWLVPDQARVITLSDDEALINYAQPIVAELRAGMGL